MSSQVSFTLPTRDLEIVGCSNGQVDLQSSLLRVPRAVRPAKAHRFLQNPSLHVDDHHFRWKGKALLQLLVTDPLREVHAACLYRRAIDCSTLCP